MKLFERIHQDTEIRQIYDAIGQMEDEEAGWAYHNWFHVNNVVAMTEMILKQLAVSEEYLEAAKIAALLHDVGALQGKAGHALRGKQFAEAYFRKQKICLPYQEEILSSIENHSNGFDSEELMTLALIISDKLDITTSRVAKAGYFVPGMRQLQFLKKIEIMLSEQEVCVAFAAEEELDLEELNAFYFMPKVFKAIAAFSEKIQRRPIILLNNQEWPVPKLKNPSTVH